MYANETATPLKTQPQYSYTSIPVHSSTTSSNSSSQCTLNQGINNLIKVILGAGMFYLPYTCYLMGYSAILFIILYGFICLYAFSLIASCIEMYLSKYSTHGSNNNHNHTHSSSSSSSSSINIIVSYADLGHASFGYIGGIYVDYTIDYTAIICIAA
jgi:hypothetical protein